MMMSRKVRVWERARGWGLPCGVAAILVASCTADRTGFRGGPPAVDFSDGGEPPEAGVCTEARCSRDLKQVIRGCEGAETIVETCSEGRGCGDGRCVDPCTSAALSKGSLGCEFVTVAPDDRTYNVGDCFVAMIANTWDLPVTITAELGATALDVSQSIYTAKKDAITTTYSKLVGPLPPGEVGLVFLSEATKSVDAANGTHCPPGVTPAFREDPMRHGTALTQAFRLKTDAPVTAYSIFPYGGASSFFPTATLLLPVASWAKNYVAVSTPAAFVESSSAGATKLENRTLQIVAIEDGTEVAMLPTADISPGEGVQAAAKGTRTTFTLSRGQVLQINQAKDLSGTAIESSKPIGVFGGAECADIPLSLPACDLTQQQTLPIAQWGHEYALVPNRPRSEIEGARDQVPWAFVGAVDGTILTYHPSRPVGAPETLGAGQAVTFITDSLVSVKSQDRDHPFHAATLMTGQSFGGTGDPDFVNVIPSEQFLDRYVFFADFTFAETALTLVRRRTARGFAPVRLECVGEVSGWVPLGTDGTYEFTWIRLTHGHRPQLLGSDHSCGYGRHVAESDGPFAVTVWGTDFCASYGYPGGTGLRTISGARRPVN